MKPDPNIVIERLGGTCAAARFFEISPAAVTDWRHKGVPKARVLHLKAVRPDVLQEQPEERKPEPASP